MGEMNEQEVGVFKQCYEKVHIRIPDGYEIVGTYTREELEAMDKSRFILLADRGGDVIILEKTQPMGKLFFGDRSAQSFGMKGELLLLKEKQANAELMTSPDIGGAVNGILNDS